LVLIIFFSARSDHFLVSTNLLNVARQVSMLGIAAVGFAFVLLLGGIDLSIGSNVTLVNIVGAWLMVNAEMNFVLAIILVLVMATAIGFVNGWIIANVQMPPPDSNPGNDDYPRRRGVYGLSGVANLWLPGIFRSDRSRIFGADSDSGHYYDHRLGHWFVYTK
jgi:predicted ABC-type sugar transport system permease subunit